MSQLELIGGQRMQLSTFDVDYDATEAYMGAVLAERVETTVEQQLEIKSPALSQINPAYAEIEGLKLTSRVGSDVKVWWGEQTEKGHRLKRLGAFMVAGTTQALDRGRAMVFAIPIAFDEALEFSAEQGFNGYQTAGMAGVAVGSVFAGWSWLAGRSLDASIDQFPDLTEAVIKNHPVMVDVVSGGVGGFVDREQLDALTPNEEGTYNIGPYDAKKTIAGKIGLLARRAYSAGLLYGITPYVGLAAAKKYSKESRVKLRRAVTAESAAALGSVAVLVSSLVTNDAFGAAEEIRDRLTDKPTLITASFALIGISAASNWANRRKAQKEQEAVIKAAEEEAAARRREKPISISAVATLVGMFAIVAGKEHLKKRLVRSLYAKN